MPHPLIVTLAIDEAAQQRFDELRRTHFPTGRTVIGAHLTLFHALPGELEEQVLATVHAAAHRRAFELHVDALMPLGRGVAYRVSADELRDVHSAIRRPFADVLSAQDAQPLRAHITVQNKVRADVARATLATLAAEFVPHSVHAIGVTVWRYLDGPWEPVRRFEFTAP